jgi:hypothetical protein
MIHAKHADVPAWLIGRRPPHHRRVPRASASVICAKILSYPATPHPSPVSQFIGSSLPITPRPPQPAPPPAPQPRHATAPVWRQPRHPCRGPPAVLPRQSAAPPAYGCGVGADSRSPEAAPALPLGPPQAPGCVLAAGTAASRTTTGRGTGRRAGMPWRSARSRIDRSIIRHSATALPMVRRCRSTDRTPRAALRKNSWRRSARRRYGRQASPAPDRPGATRRGKPRRPHAVRLSPRSRRPGTAAGRR